MHFYVSPRFRGSFCMHFYVCFLWSRILVIYMCFVLPHSRTESMHFYMSFRYPAIGVRVICRCFGLPHSPHRGQDLEQTTELPSEDKTLKHSVEVQTDYKGFNTLQRLHIGTASMQRDPHRDTERFNRGQVFQNTTKVPTQDKTWNRLRSFHQRTRL
jgi:hypothetical protein